MHILWTLLIGLVIGAVAKFLMPGKDPGGFIVTGLLGVAGMFVGGFLAQMLGFKSVVDGSIEPSGFIGGVIGAVILLIIYRLFRRNTTA